MLRLWHLLWIFSFQSKILFGRNNFFFYRLFNFIFGYNIRFNKFYFLLLINFNFLFRWFNLNFAYNLYSLLNFLLIFLNNFLFFLVLKWLLDLRITKRFRLLFFYLMSICLFLSFFRNLYLIDNFNSLDSCICHLRESRRNVKWLLWFMSP